MSVHSFSYLTPPVISPDTVKKLIEKRNGIFEKAVNELILAASGEDPVFLLQESARDYIPVDPIISHMLPATEEPGLLLSSEEDRPSIASIIEDIVAQEWYKDQIVNRRTVEAKLGRTAQLTPSLPDAVIQALEQSRNITNLYTHQVSAIQWIEKGKNVIVSTSTASGKSVIYQVPLLCSLKENPASTSIFVYPTKALAQDQKLSLQRLLHCCPGLEKLFVATYDGDTPREARAAIRESASVIFTNFDTLHASILPHEESWRSFFKRAKLFVVDELHYYSVMSHKSSGVFVGCVRRLAVNSEIRFVSCSATISNPARHMRDLFGIAESDIEVVTEDGAPAGPKEYLIWNQSLIAPKGKELGKHSALSEATQLMKFLMERGLRVVLFCKENLRTGKVGVMGITLFSSRTKAMKSLTAYLSNEGRHDILARVRPYRGGYLQEDRRRIEQEAFGGLLLGIIATNALELGVDIGVLDAVIMLGFPMSIASFRQQAGRVGRRARDSLAVLITEAWPIDQYYKNNPDELYNQAPDDLLLDLNNKIILEAHLQCAAYEMPLSTDDIHFFGPQLPEICQTKLIKDEDGWYHPHSSYLPYPSSHISIRGVQEEKYVIIEVTSEQGSQGILRILEEVEESRALFEVYEGGVFMHQGSSFVVKEVSHDSKTAKAVRADVNWITSPRDFTDVDAIQTYRIREITRSSFRAYYGRVEVRVKVFGFFKIRDRKVLDAVDIDTPSWIRETTGFWIDVPKAVLDLMQDKNINAAEAIHAAQHALLNQFAFSDDVKTECKAGEKEYRVTPSRRKRPARLIFYDAVGRDGGMAVKAFDSVRDLLEKAHTAMECCPCIQGCRRCRITVLNFGYARP
ncbi:hypothetical protein AX17_003329 [Amanita inopinata Kibby_2008]|nr:hypothetical protein AX17_003329 [Amanita inopinata Kibby_2008]